MASTRSRWRKAGYWVFLLLFTGTCMEVGARWYLAHMLDKAPRKKFQFSYYRVYEHVPGFHEGDAEGDWIVINANGFRRGSDVTSPKPPGTIRIFLMGASAAHGISSARPFPIRHVRMNETIDAYLEKMLAARMPGKHVEVINAAVTGYETFQQTAYLLSEILDYHPDMVIFFDGVNDYYANNPDMRYLMDFKFQFWKERLQRPGFGSVLTQTVNWLAGYSGFFRAVLAWELQHDAINRRDRIDIYGDHADDASRIAGHEAVASSQYLRSLETNLFLLQREGIATLLCLQPLLVLRDSSLLSQDEIDFHVRDRNKQVLQPFVAHEVRTAAEKWNAGFMDMNAPFRDPALAGRQLFIDDVHLTPLGGEICARAMAPLVEELLKREPAVDGLPVVRPPEE